MVRTARQLVELDVEAVGVCLLWSIVNPHHELAVEEVLAREAPDLPVTLSHRVNPVIREYHRASAACIDASLKPLMTTYLAHLRERLRAAGFDGRLLVSGAAGGLLEPEWLAGAPIHSINSGPAMAPVAGRHHAEREGGSANAIVVDTGGTSFDVSLVRQGRIPRTRETWLGHRFVGHLTGFPAVDVRTTGAGGGSIAEGRRRRPADRRARQRRFGARPRLLRPRRQRGRPSPTPAWCSATSSLTGSAGSGSTSTQRRRTARSRR